MTSILWFLLSLCLYPCTHASGGLVLIARQASKCLQHAHLLFFFFSKSYSQPLKWAGLCMALNHQSLNLLRQSLQFFLILGSSSPAGCLASWRGARAAPRRTCVTCLQRWTRSSPPWPSSTSSTKSCWGRSCTGEGSSALTGVAMHLVFLQYHLFKAVLVVFEHRAWLFP